MALMEVDLTALSNRERQRIDEICRSERAHAIVKAKARQAAAVKAARDCPPRAIEGLGGQTMVMDPAVWSIYRNGYRTTPGEEQEMQDWLLKKWPEWFRVRHTGTKTQVGYGSTTVASVTRGHIRERRIYRSAPQ